MRASRVVEPELRKRGAQPGGGPPLTRVVALLRIGPPRSSSSPTRPMLFYAVEVDPGTPDWDETVGSALRMLKARLSTVSWDARLPRSSRSGEVERAQDAAGGDAAQAPGHRTQPDTFHRRGARAPRPRDVLHRLSLHLDQD